MMDKGKMKVIPGGAIDAMMKKCKEGSEMNLEGSKVDLVGIAKKLSNKKYKK